MTILVEVLYSSTGDRITLNRFEQNLLKTPIAFCDAH